MNKLNTNNFLSSFRIPFQNQILYLFLLLLFDTIIKLTQICIEYSFYSLETLFLTIRFLIFIFSFLLIIFPCNSQKITSEFCFLFNKSLILIAFLEFEFIIFQNDSSLSRFVDIGIKIALIQILFFSKFLTISMKILDLFLGITYIFTRLWIKYEFEIFDMLFISYLFAWFLLSFVLMMFKSSNPTKKKTIQILNNDDISYVLNDLDESILIISSEKVFLCNDQMKNLLNITYPNTENIFKSFLFQSGGMLMQESFSPLNSLSKSSPKNGPNNLTKSVYFSSFTDYKKELNLEEMFLKPLYFNYFTILVYIPSKKSYYNLQIKNLGSQSRQSNLDKNIKIVTKKRNSKFYNLKNRESHDCSDYFSVVLYPAYDHKIRSIETALENQNKMLSYVSHDFRTPLNCISSSLQILMDNVNDKYKGMCIEPAISSTKFLLNMVNDILDIAQIKEGRFRIVDTKFNLLILLKEVVNLFKIPAEAHNIILNVDFQKGLPEIMSNDPNRIRQILTNLIGK